MPKFSQTQLAYLAGIIDGEGYVGILTSKPNDNVLYHMVVEVTMCQPEAIELISKFDSKKLQKVVRKFPRRDKYVYKLTAKKAYEFLKMIRKYLLVKRSQCNLCMKLQEDISKGIRTGYNILPPTANRYRKNLYLQCKRLNKRGVGK